ncbi:MAG TPA: xanthine dehydrogenase family protein molybdopterin-binding subunit, partial [Burkholderiales bacterium]|nr:xanthine dehydrogenase family protein molybdopterin-binding subunit [Burkholderiales bacterium]
MKYVGASLRRKEDDRLLRGQGRYVADLELPGLLHAVFVRSPVAHARIRAVSSAQARAMAGVVLVLDGKDLERALPPVRDNQMPLPSGWKSAIPHRILNPRQPLLAVDKARHVGEAVAVVLAETRTAAEDAAEAVEVDYDMLPALVDPEAALAGDAVLVHEQLKTNEIGWFEVTKGDPDGAFARAPHRLQRRITHHRYAAMPMECRAVAAQYDVRTDSYTVWSSTQVVHWVRSEIAGTLDVPEGRIRVIAPDVGGGFGVKGHVYPEDMLVPFLARMTGRAVRWVEDRREHITCSCHSRDQLHDAEIAFDDDGRILAVRDRFIVDCGAWNPLGVAVVYNTAAHLPGPYRIPHFRIEARVATTNKVPNAPYRGAGRPEAVQVMERLVDLVAAELGLDPVEVRRRNMIGASEMPYAQGIPYRDGAPIVYDSGDYPAALDKALEALGGVAAFRARQAQARRDGRYLGLGLGCYTEGTGVGSFEGATVRIEPSGKIHLSSGACPHGQGMETVFAQVAADAWRVRPEDVLCSFGDTASIPMGFGTLASRTTVTVSAAIQFASSKLKEKLFAIAGHKLECAVADLELREGGAVGVVGVPGAQVSLAELARIARPGWDHGRPPGVEAGLEVTHYFEPPTVTWAYAAHAAIVEVDTETGRIGIERYVVSHDCGVLVNPLLADAQIVGGVAQGLGGALYEDIAYDAQGQLLSGTFMDYAMPKADDIPPITLVHQETPSPLNPLGVKGLGEGGAISPPVVLANAVCDALAPFGIELNSTPIRPEALWRAV